MNPNESGPGVTTPRPATSTISATAKQLDHQQGNRSDASAVVFGWLLRAVLGAIYDRVMVRSCCWCGFAHLHYVPVGTGTTVRIVRSPRCAPHRSYVVEITRVVPAVVVPGRRLGGAA